MITLAGVEARSIEGPTMRERVLSAIWDEPEGLTWPELRGRFLADEHEAVHDAIEYLERRSLLALARRYHAERTPERKDHVRLVALRGFNFREDT